MNSKDLIYACTIILLLFSFAHADSVVQTWSAIYNDALNLNDTPADIAVDSYGNVYVTGFTFYDSSTDIVTIKYNPQGVQQWLRTYDYGTPAADDFAYAMTVDASGNVYIAGQTLFESTGFVICTTLKYDTSGTLKWARNYQGTATSGTNTLRDIIVDSSGNVYVTGDCVNKNTNTDYITIKYDSSGNKVWEAVYNSSGTANDQSGSLASDSYGNIYVTGTTGTVKYNSSGVKQWAVETGIMVYGFAIDSSANIYILSFQNYTFYLLKYNSAGTKQWSSLYPNPPGTTAYPSSIALDASGNAYITGLRGTLTNGTDGVLTAKFGSSGVLQWDKIYNTGSSPSSGGAIACDQWTGIYATAIANGKLITLKYDSDGNEKWNTSFSLNCNISWHPPIFIKSGEIYVISRYYSLDGSCDYLTVRYDQHFCKQYSPADLNKDCRVDFADFADFTLHWAECNKYPVTDCTQ